MHQTFYIDIDEEITSIVDRLRKAKAKEVVVVVPKRAMLIQSIVNLKLLKKEADSMGKDIVLVTQDKLGKLLIEKTGIKVEQRIDDVEGMEVIAEKEIKPSTPMQFVQPEADRHALEAKKRVSEIGSSDYFENNAYQEMMRIGSGEEEAGDAEQSAPQEPIINRELVTEIGKDLRKKRSRGANPSLDIVRNIDIRQAVAENFEPQPEIIPSAKKLTRKRGNMEIESAPLGNKKDEPAQAEFADTDFFRKAERREVPAEPEIRLSGKPKKVFFIFGFIALLCGAGLAAYLFLPKAEVTVFAKTKTQSVDAQLKATASTLAPDAINQVLPGRSVSVEVEQVETFSATGSKDETNQKAHGMLTIYNEFSPSPQPLVATTRFQSESGKIFRLTKGITVPGTSVVSGVETPGAIEAEVIADEPGTDYNIEPTRFSIPGFQGSGNEKFTKIYAKSSKAFTGGGSGTEKIKTVSASDIQNAKNKVLVKITDSVREKLKETMSGDEFLIEDAFTTNNATYLLSNSEGDATDSFTVTVKETANAIVFKRADLEKILGQMIIQKGNGKSESTVSGLELQFGKSDVNQDAKELTIRVNATGKIVPEIDLDQVKKGLLGKNEEQIKAYLKDFSIIDHVDVKFWPEFLVNTMPAYESRVTVTLDNN